MLLFLGQTAAIVCRMTVTVTVTNGGEHDEVTFISSTTTADIYFGKTCCAQIYLPFQNLRMTKKRNHRIQAPQLCQTQLYLLNVAPLY